MKNLLALLLLLIVGCGISPEDAASELERSAAAPEEWCGYKPEMPDLNDVSFPEVVNKSFVHPVGYGITAEYGCDPIADWPGGFCWAPATKTHKWRVFNDGTDPTWIEKMNNEFGVMRDILNAHDWSITKVSDNSWTMASRIGTVNPDGSGTLGASKQTVWTNYGDLTGQGDYMTYAKCEAWTYRTSIEANVFYQAASSAEKDKYVKNIAQHEGGHCVGLPHRPEADLLMSVVHHYPGPRFSNNLNWTTSEIDALDVFDPIW